MYWCLWVSLVAQCKKNPLAMQEAQEMWVWALGQEDPLEEGMTTHSSILAWRIPWTEESGGLQSRGSQRAGRDWNDWAYHTNIYRSFLSNRQKQSTGPSTGGWVVSGHGPSLLAVKAMSHWEAKLMWTHKYYTTQKAPCCLTPFIWHSRKAKL